MSVNAIFATTMALRRRIETAAKITNIHVGAPNLDDVGDGGVALTLFGVQPSAALRNTPRFAPAPTTGPVKGSGALIEAVPLDLRYLIVCFRAKGMDNGLGEPDELTTLGRIIAALHADPVLNAAAAPPEGVPPQERDAALAEQLVRLSLESYMLDDWNRLWALFPEISFRTSVVYLATPVFVTIGDARSYPRVQSREAHGGIAEPGAKVAA